MLKQFDLKVLNFMHKFKIRRLNVLRTYYETFSLSPSFLSACTHGEGVKISQERKKSIRLMKVDVDVRNEGEVLISFWTLTNSGALKEGKFSSSCYFFLEKRKSQNKIKHQIAHCRRKMLASPSELEAKYKKNEFYSLIVMLTS